LRVSLLLNGATPVELAHCCSFLEEVYSVPFTGFMHVDADPAGALAGVPSAWDYVVENHRARERSHDGFGGFRAFFDAASAYFEADGRTTSRLRRGDLDRLLRVLPAAIDCFDRPLLEQLALIEASALLVSPHTGFAFGASTVGTPWLAISSGNWHEYFFNGVPVYSLLPDPERYPSFAWGELGLEPLKLIDADDDGEGPRTPSMSAARIRDDLPELLEAAELLIEKRLPYEQALAEYFPRLLAAYGGNRSRVFSFDNIHEQYLP
jgi:hypothetical protein